MQSISKSPAVTPQSSQPSAAERRAAREHLSKYGKNTDLPTLGNAVSCVVHLTSSDDEAVHNLAHFVLSDVTLTQKILRLANAVVYRSVSGVPVTTVSKAIFVMGFDAVKTSALAMLLVDGLSNPRHVQQVRVELAQALCASVFARELGRQSKYLDSEEAAVAALFKNLGCLLVATHDNALYADIMRVAQTGEVTLSQAAAQSIGCSFDTLGEYVLQEWQIPDTIVRALSPLPTGVQKAPPSRQEWLQLVATFSADAARLMNNGTINSPAALNTLLARFGTALHLDQAKLTELLAGVAQQVGLLTESVGIAPSKDDTALTETDFEPGLPRELMLAAMSTPTVNSNQRHPSGKPMQARDMLLAGVQDVTQMMASGRCKVNELTLLVLETIYGSLGFRFATVCFKDLKTGQYRARLGIGENAAARQAGFAFPIAASRDVFNLAMENNVDLMIADASAASMRELLPLWHRNLLPDARSFIVLPLVVRNIPLGLFYADRVLPAPEGVAPDETALIKTLKGQVLAALNPH
ncbi:MAG: HDOD domain-containing protein [Pseudomonadota bacterium]